RLAHERRERERSRRAAAPATEREHLLDQIASTLARQARLIEVRCRLCVGTLRAFQREYDVAHDARQQVVEVVGDPAGQVADRLHFLRLAKLSLETLAVAFDLAALRQVADNRQHVRLAAMLDRNGTHFDRKVLAVPVDRLELLVAALATQRARNDLLLPLSVLGSHLAPAPTREDLLATVSVHPLVSGIDVDPLRTRVPEHERIRRCVEGRAILLLT